MSNVTFSKEELERYSRHLIIPEFNIEGQRRLKSARVLVVGTGGLGAPLLQYLTAAGVGTIGVVDFDTVDASNLQRQVLFTLDDVGRPKAEAAVARLRRQNPHVQFEVYPVRLTSENALSIIGRYDVVADGTDNFPTRYLVNDACVLTGKVNVYASIFRFEGQVSVFNYRGGPHYRDLFPEPPPPGLVPSCAEGGVLGVLPGIIGSVQASEVIKVVTGVGQPLSGRLFLFDALHFETRIVKIGRDQSATPVTELIDYEVFCGLNESPQDQVREITVHELHQWRQSGKDFQLIDVREEYEFEIANLGGELIPLGTIAGQVDRIRPDGDVVLYCRSGRRSAQAVEILRQRYGFDNLYNLRGGILSWAGEIDRNMPMY
jgi:adenylyltransferase/sulfurtransferase